MTDWNTLETLFEDTEVLSNVFENQLEIETVNETDGKKVVVYFRFKDEELVEVSVENA